MAETGEWDRLADTGPWGQAAGREPADRSAETGQWDRFTDTGQWDRFVDTGQWDRFVDTGQWDRFVDTDDRVGDPECLEQSPDADPAGRSEHGPPDGFWSGTRLAGDDPRWMGTPTSAPRSPAVAGPVPPYGDPDPGPRPQPASTPPPRPASPRVDDLLHAEPGGGPLASMLYTAAWYAVPLLVALGWVLTLDAGAPRGCVADATGGGCESDRAHAVASMLSAGPRFAAALGASLLISVLLRWASGTWRAAGVGFAAAVIGGGLSTVVVSLLSSHSLG